MSCADDDNRSIGYDGETNSAHSNHPRDGALSPSLLMFPNKPFTTTSTRALAHALHSNSSYDVDESIDAYSPTTSTNHSPTGGNNTTSIDIESPCERLGVLRPTNSSDDLAALYSPTSCSAYRMGELGGYTAAKVAAHEAEIKLAPEGEGGTYFVVPTKKHHPSSGGGGGAPRPTASMMEKVIAVFKPKDEEIGCPGNPRGNTELERQGFTAGEGYKHEALAFILDYDHFAGVPETAIVELEGKIGSLQRFVPRTKQSWDLAPGRFSVSAVHRVGIFDLRTLNGDRHGGNMLVPKADPTMIVPIDHSYILPAGWADPDFEWMDWPQAKIPFSDGELEYIASLSPQRDQALVTETLGEECGDTILTTTMVLKVAAARGYTLTQIAHFCRRETLTMPSGLEQLIGDCRDLMTMEIDVDAVSARLEKHFPPLS